MPIQLNSSQYASKCSGTQPISSRADKDGVHVKADISHCHCEGAATGLSAGTGESRSLVLKKLQSSVRPEVLEELMDGDEGVSVLP